MANGQSIDTTMGFSTLDGLVMSTRCGALDPGVLLYFLNHKKLTGSAIEQLLYEQSGLLAVSGLSGDMRVLLASDQPGAHDAIALFNFHVVRQVGALTASLGGLDGLIFTGGIGEHAPAIRAGICSKLTWLGVYVDDPVPAPCATRISRTGGPVEVHVIHTNEESMIADETAQVMRATKVPAHG
jgi:acetate kinase